MNEIIKAGKDQVVMTKYGFDFDLGHSNKSFKDTGKVATLFRFPHLSH